MLSMPPAPVIKAIIRGRAQTYWAELRPLRKLQKCWNGAIHVLEERIRRKESSDPLAEQTLDRVFALPWYSGRRGFDKCDVKGLANLCKPTVWLKTTEINQMLELLDDDEMLQARGIRVVPSNYPRNIVSAYKDQNYDHSPRYRLLRTLGETFANGDAKEIVTITNVNGDHWVAVIVDFASQTIYYFDSAKRPINVDLRTAYDWWIDQHHHAGFDWISLPYEECEAAAGLKHKEREAKYAAAIEAGVRNEDFTLKDPKKRRILKPELRDEPSSRNIGELSRPMRQIENRFKERHRTHRSGREKIREPAERVYKNWKSMFLLDRILRAGIQTKDPTKGLSSTAIVKYLQIRDRETFGSLSATTLQSWFDRDNLGGRIWMDSKGGRKGALVSKKIDEYKLALTSWWSAYPEVVERVEEQLMRLREVGTPLNLIAVRAVIIATIQTMAPEVFEMRYSDGSIFKVSDSYCCAFLRMTMEWLERKLTKAAQHTPKNWEDMGVVYNPGPGAKLTWAPWGSPQVAVIGADEKRAFTALLAISLPGTVLHIQSMYSGATGVSCPMPTAPKYAVCAAANFRHVPSKSGNHWSNLGSMEDFVVFILDRYFEEEKKRLGLPPDQKSLWILDV
ncbi:hypothetical protein K438DRAFT_1977134 [Mycena galopus ATCC 62051]|nr:hypothetical protein K438DRAFT_1977134 [Mycena galopus ATCC 62051]